jgi:hypothetical protein
MDEKFLEIARNKTNAIETLLQITDMINCFLQQFNPSVNYDLMKYHPEVWAMLLEYKRKRVFDYVRENLVHGMREGLYRRDMDPYMIAGIYVSRIKTGMDKDLSPVVDADFRKFFAELINYHIRGIVSPKGLELFEKISKEHKLFQKK